LEGRREQRRRGDDDVDGNNDGGDEELMQMMLKKANRVAQLRRWGCCIERTPSWQRCRVLLQKQKKQQQP